MLPEGALAQYSCRCHQTSFDEEAVRKDDEILEVNGQVWESSEQQLRDKLEEDELLFIVFRRRRCMP